MDQFKRLKLCRLRRVLRVSGRSQAKRASEPRTVAHAQALCEKVIWSVTGLPFLSRAARPSAF